MNVLLTGAWADAQKHIGDIETLGHKVYFQQWEQADLVCDYAAVEGIVGNGIFLYHPVEKFVNLKYIQLTSAGYDRVPMDYIQSHGITIRNARGVYSIPMAEFALAGVLQLYKQSRYFYGKQQAKRWEKHRGLLELYGKTVVIVGCGSVGDECAKRFKAFGCTVTGVDIIQPSGIFYDSAVDFADLDRVLESSDIVILALPLTEDTKGLFNRARFRVMKQGSVLINIARGALVNTGALLEALDGRLAGAVLDVFEEEPLGTNSSLWTMDNVILTPHNSFVGEGNSGRLAQAILAGLSQW